MHLDLLRLHARHAPAPAAARSNSPTTRKIAVLELSTPDTAPIARGLQFETRSPLPSSTASWWTRTCVSLVANTRPRNSSGTCRSNCETFSTELTAMADARERQKKRRQPKIRHLAEHHVGAAVDHVTNATVRLVGSERKPLAQPVRERAARRAAQRPPPPTDIRCPPAPD